MTRLPPEIVHDVKTESPDLLPPLPMVLRLIPILFYLSAFGAVLLLVLTFIQIRVGAVELENARQQEREATEDLGRIATERSQLEGRLKRASEIAAWVEGSIPLQPLVASIARSMDERSAINELVLARDRDQPIQIQLSLKMQTPVAEQLETTLAAIRDASFRAFQAEQSQTGTRIEYEVTLVRPTTVPFVRESEDSEEPSE